VLDHLDGVVRAMPEAPALVGHSMGGLLVQLLLQRGLGACGVAIDPAPPKGVFVPSWSFLRSNWPVVSPFAGDAPYLMPFEHWVYTFAHRLPEAEARAAYDAHVVPESRNVARGPTTDVALIDFKKRRAPLLILAGSDDRIVPAALNRKNHACYAGADAITDFHEFAGRTHYLIGAPGWEEVADHAAGWIESTLS
jgi:pimeloyl-ACP methyl ester carboxylesterase